MGNCVQVGTDPRALFSGQPHQIHGLYRTHVCLACIQAAGQQDFFNQLVQLGDVARDFCFERG